MDYIGMFELEMVISWLETQRNELVSWQVRRFGGVCALPDCDWFARKNIASSSLDLENATRMMESAPTYMTHLK